MGNKEKNIVLDYWKFITKNCFSFTSFFYTYFSYIFVFAHFFVNGGKIFVIPFGILPSRKKGLNKNI